MDSCIRNTQLLSPINGRGKIIKKVFQGKKIVIIDDSYNSNPESLSHAIKNLKNYYLPHSRKICVIGDMLELGEETESEHINISNYDSIKKIDKIYCVGINMKMLYDKLSTNQKGGWFKTTEDLIKELRNFATNADIILVKASNSFKFHQVIDKIKGMGKVLPH